MTDPRFNGEGNYLDWLINVLDPLDLTEQNLDEIIEYIRGQRTRYQLDGKKPKKHEEGKKLDLAKLGLVSQSKPMTRRRI